MASAFLRYRTYVVFLGAALFVLAVRSVSAETVEWLRPVVLAASAVAFAGTRLRVSRLGTAIAVPNLILAAGFSSLAPPLAALLATSVAMARYRLEHRSPRSASGFLIRALCAGGTGFWSALVYAALAGAAGSPLWAPASASVIFLLGSGVSESILERAPYWRRLWFERTRGGLILALLWTPAAVAIGLLFLPPAGSEPGVFHGDWFWAGLSVCILLYGLCEYRLGPLYEDQWRQEETDRIFLSAVEALALAVDAKDSVSSGHLKRVQRYTTEIAKALGRGDHEVRTLEFGALLHDIGKIAVPEGLLTKPGRLSPEEFNHVASHVQIGAEILAAVNFPLPVAELVLCHHENWDGTGYPRRLKGDAIPLTARILTVVDAFDALTTDRPYRPAMKVEDAIEHIKSHRGTAFDPRVTDVLIELLPRLEPEIRRDPQTNRQSAERRLSLQSPRSIDVRQTSLTPEERIESLKQLRGVARQPVEDEDFQTWERLLATLGLHLTPRQLLEFVFAPLASRVPFDECAVLMLSDGALTPIYCPGRETDMLRKLRCPIDHSPSGWVARHGESLVNGNPMGEHSELGLMAWAMGLKAALVVALWENGRVVGTFNLYSKTAGVYSREQADWTERVTETLGPILRRALTFDRGPLPTDDRLTGLPGANAILRRLRAEVDLARKEERSSSVLFLNIEDFHAVNARFGFQRGDQLLRVLAKTAGGMLRKLDYLGRLGEDQFLAVLGGIQDRDLEVLAARLQRELSRRLTEVHREPGVATRVGVASASFPADGPTAEELVVVSKYRLHQRPEQPTAPAESESREFERRPATATEKSPA